MGRKVRVLYLCTGNSCRSQMAEAWTRTLHGGRFEVASAGVVPTTLDPFAVRVMAEQDVDLGGQQPKHLRDLAGFTPDVVITVCDNAREHCPVFPGRARVLHRGFDDPPALSVVSTKSTRSKNVVDEKRVLDLYRRVCHEIHDFVETLPEFLEQESK